ncbi:MAG TPA: hypothetical protein VIG24_15720, partial [Acidimicrobiia bacterium]
LHRTLRDQPADGQVEGEGANGDEEGDVTPPGNPDLQAKTPPTEPETEPKTEPKTSAPGEDDETWEHKYKSIHGRYTRSQEQVRSLADQIQNLQNVIATLRAAPEPEKKAETPSELDPSNLITPEEAADYGEDFLKVVGKRARQEMAPVIDGYKKQIEQLQKQLEGVNGFVKQDSQQKLLSNLDKELPNWRDLNTNSEFLDWLGLPDPYSGAIRHDMLKAAYAQGNAHRVLAFFNGFLAEEAAVAPAGGEPDPSVTRVAKVPLKDLAAPGRAKTAAASPAPAEKPFITRSEVAKFYAQVAAGQYRGRDKEKDVREAEIFSAQREGRIR